jgi:hypothetical protein
LDIIDRQPDGDHYFTQCQAGTFIGDISMFTGEPTLGRSRQHEGTARPQTSGKPERAVRATMA